jgi:hypothetical protein
MATKTQRADRKHSVDRVEHACMTLVRHEVAALAIRSAGKQETHHHQADVEVLSGCQCCCSHAA